MKLKCLTLLVWVAVANSLFAQNSADVIVYISTYKEMAISEMQRTGIPAAIILAQGIHETEAGTSDLVKKSNNHFGIKCKENWTGSVVYHDDDTRGECFRSYDNPLDSYKDHSDFLRASARYQSLFKLDPEDYEGWAYGLKKAGYATNIKYPQILVKLVRDYNLQQYTLIAMGKLPAGRETLDLSAQNNRLIQVQPATVYPEGVFSINNTRVVFAHSGSSLLTLADQYQVPLARLIDFNDLRGEEILVNDQLIYLQRKRKLGAKEFHLVKAGESLYGICQQEGIRFESILGLNQLVKGEEPAPGEKIYLQSAAPAKPTLLEKKSLYADSAQEKEKNVQAAASAPITHIVQTKETLYSISKKYNVDIGQLQQWNRLDSAGLKTGQELIIYKN
jgi:LysM repeat protein